MKYRDIEADSFEQAEVISITMPEQDVAGPIVRCDDFRTGRWQLHSGSKLHIIESSILCNLPGVQAEELE